MGALGAMRIVCCLFIVISNIISIFLGLIFLLIGCLLTWGFAVLSAALGTTLESLTGSFSDVLKSSFGFSIDILEMVRNLVQITGGIGAFFLVLGLFLIIFGCIGCCGACCSKKVCLLIYAIAVGVIFLAQLIVVIIWFSNADIVKQTAKNSMYSSIKEFTGISSQNVQTLLQNVIQIFIGCCGVDNGTDFHIYSSKWNRNVKYNQSGQSFDYNLTYPITCCKFDLTNMEPKDTYCPYNNTNTDTSWYQVGCYDKVFSFIDQHFNLNILFYILGGTLGFQLLLVLGAILIVMAIVNDNKVKPH